MSLSEEKITEHIDTIWKNEYESSHNQLAIQQIHDIYTKIITTHPSIDDAMSVFKSKEPATTKMSPDKAVALIIVCNPLPKQILPRNKT